ncbi:MAG: cytidine deaminase [Oscillatoria sp. PMC 1068.18]|nr:cytidine deaminase [Oscillatoria sp. PMC 1076.18]MEC4988780.1 cytidine deaminase [Oscillatoria sp. PMC 1068.18]
MNISTEEKAELIAAAKSVTVKAYAPYSGFRVGAAVLTEMGNIFVGCNVENSSYGMTICAERAAIVSAVAREGGETMKIRAIAIASNPVRFCSPCGACRQFIYEFGADAVVIFPGRDQVQAVLARELLPEGFSWM